MSEIVDLRKSAPRPSAGARLAVNRAREYFSHTPRDQVFVVIDGEQVDLPDALALCETPIQRGNNKKGRPEIRIQPIVSHPCFEVWLLLHFRFCDQPFRGYGDVEAELLASLPEYTKSDRQIFARVGGGEGLQRAVLHTPRLREALMQTGAQSPATDMDRLVELLRALVPQRQPMSD